MTTRTPEPAAADGTPSCPRRRGAAETSQLLLDAARRRFAVNGYAATTVRDIAGDAGVNVALINRYFTSKEGLFEACLAGAADEIGRTVAEDATLDQVPRNIARHLVGSEPGAFPHQLLLLLRSSGDERAEQIRRGVLRSFTERLAATAGWRPGHPDGDRLLLGAQVAISAAFGIVVLRSSTALEPLASASEQDLVGPIRDLITVLLAPGPRRPPGSV